MALIKCVSLQSSGTLLYQSIRAGTTTATAILTLLECNLCVQNRRLCGFIFAFWVLLISIIRLVILLLLLLLQKCCSWHPADTRFITFVGFNTLDAFQTTQLFVTAFFPFCNQVFICKSLVQTPLIKLFRN